MSLIGTTGNLKPIGFTTVSFLIREELRNEQTQTSSSSLGIILFPFIHLRKNENI